MGTEEEAVSLQPSPSFEDDFSDDFVQVSLEWLWLDREKKSKRRKEREKKRERKGIKEKRKQ